MILDLPNGKRIIAMESDVEIESMGPDPFGRGERTVFYRDYNIDGGRERFYMWAIHWSNSYPNITLPEPPARPDTPEGE
jgi:hypothetical protein